MDELQTDLRRKCFPTAQLRNLNPKWRPSRFKDRDEAVPSQALAQVSVAIDTWYDAHRRLIHSYSFFIHAIFCTGSRRRQTEPDCTVVLPLRVESEFKRCRQTTYLRGDVMKRTLSTLLTTLLFSAVMVPNAKAQIQKPGFPISFAIGSAAIADPAVVDETMPTATKTDVLPATSTNPAPNRNAIRAERSSSKVDFPSVNSSYPGYCPALPIGTQPGDWDYREALEKCLYGS